MATPCRVIDRLYLAYHLVAGWYGLPHCTDQLLCTKCGRGFHAATNGMEGPPVRIPLSRRRRNE